MSGEITEYLTTDKRSKCVLQRKLCFLSWDKWWLGNKYCTVQFTEVGVGSVVMITNKQQCTK